MAYKKLARENYEAQIEKYNKIVEKKSNLVTKISSGRVNVESLQNQIKNLKNDIEEKTEAYEIDLGKFKNQENNDSLSGISKMLHDKKKYLKKETDKHDVLF